MITCITHYDWSMAIHFNFAKYDTSIILFEVGDNLELEENSVRLCTLLFQVYIVCVLSGC